MAEKVMNAHYNQDTTEDSGYGLGGGINEFKRQPLVNNTFDFDEERNKAEYSAWEALSQGKFQLFAYWVDIWLYLNKSSGRGKKNPFAQIITFAKLKLE